MALTTLAQVQVIPGMARQSAAFIDQLIGAASQSIKKFCKRDLEYTTYEGTSAEYHSGSNWPDLILRQRPVAQGDVTGVWVSNGSYAGQGTNPFPASSLLVDGTNYFLVLDSSIGGVACSERGILRMIGGGMQGWPNILPSAWGWGKLSGTRQPGWALGYGNIKVEYSAGYREIPEDLSMACATLVAAMVRFVPTGSPLTSENLGAYSYNIMTQSVAGNIPELGTVGMVLRSYRERAL